MHSLILLGAFAATGLSQDMSLNQTTSAPSINITDVPEPTAYLPTTVTAIYLPGFTSPAITLNGTYNNVTIPLPTVTYIYWEESCSCHQTSSCAASAVPKSLSTTTVTYSEPACGCTTTVEAPCAETVIPVAKSPTVAPVAPAVTSSMPAPVASAVSSVAVVATSASPVAPAAAAFTGAAERRTVFGSGVAFLAVGVALVLA